MLKLKRSFENPILVPDSTNVWEAKAAFNPCVVKEGPTYHMVYRTRSEARPHLGEHLEVSSIGYANSHDHVHFQNKKLLIKPEFEWEKFGCEDPRITKIDGTYYIFYTALSLFPFRAEGIKSAVAKTKDLNIIDEKHPVTTFNSKGMTLFPERINGKLAAILTADTDQPPSTIGIALFDNEEDIWSEKYWGNWYKDLDNHKINLLRDPSHQVEVGAPPIKTDKGWLIIFAYIKEYFTPDRKFGIEAVLLDLKDPRKIVARTKDALLTPREEYELYGTVPYTIFPTGAVVDKGMLHVYYGSTDTTGSVASCPLEELLKQMFEDSKPEDETKKKKVSLTRFEKNPIITPLSQNDWECRATYNPAAIYEAGKVHILYRAESFDHTSVIGYASSSDGVNIDERLEKPAYVPREDFESKKQSGNSGCEDPRLTRFEDRIYMFYTAYNAVDPTRVVMTNIKVDDFVSHDWKWEKPVIVSPRDINDKNACLLPEKINDKYVIFHRTNHMIWIDWVENLDFAPDQWIQGNILFEPKEDSWYSEKVGIAAPPIKTDEGWLLVFHALSKHDLKYRLGAMLLDPEDPLKITHFLDYPILEPEADYECCSGLRPGTVFSCGAVVVKNKLFVYYGGGDSVVAVAHLEMKKLMEALKQNPYDPQSE